MAHLLHHVVQQHEQWRAPAQSQLRQKQLVKQLLTDAASCAVHAVDPKVAEWLDRVAANPEKYSLRAYISSKGAPLKPLQVQPDPAIPVSSNSSGGGGSTSDSSAQGGKSAPGVQALILLLCSSNNNPSRHVDSVLALLAMLQQVPAAAAAMCAANTTPLWQHWES